MRRITKHDSIVLVTCLSTVNETHSNMPHSTLCTGYHMSNESNTQNNDTEEQETKEITVYGWTELAPSTTLTIDAETAINDISYETQLEALKETVREKGYDPERFHIEVDYIEKSFTQDCPDSKTMYEVMGWCESAPSTAITIPESKTSSSISDADAIAALRSEIEANGIDPDDVHIEIHEIIEEKH